MKKVIAKKWAQALRSKKYRQATGVLKTKTKAGAVSHCCLGVLCELYQQERKKAKKSLFEVDDLSAGDCLFVGGVPKTNRVFEFDGLAQVLPSSVRVWAGLFDESGGFRPGFTLTKRGHVFGGLAEMNDAGWRFSTIADVIEERADKI